MISFILDMVIMLSLGAVLYLVARTLPRVNDVEFEESEVRPHWVTVYLEKIDEKFQAVYEKFLRRFRVWIMKLDNSVSEKLGKFKKESDKNSGLNFGLGEDKKEEEETQ